jgi:hypothetical protein
MKYIIIWLLIFTISCTPKFNKPRYKKPLQIGYNWERRKILVFKTGTYQNPLVKKETKREMIKPKTINLDNW